MTGHTGLKGAWLAIWTGETDKLMNSTFWIGVYPGMKKEMLGHIVTAFDTFIGYL